MFQKYKPEIVFHLAAQPLVRLSYEKPKETYEINIIGTLNVLECIRKTESVRVGVMITTDKCYENNEQIWGYRESDPMGGNDPYSSSKGCCELLISSYRNSYFNIKNYDKHGKAISSARAGNVIGGGDWAKDRIVPDCIKALRNNENISIRNPYSIRPWQHVLEPLNGYLMLATKMYEEPIKYSGGWNFGPNPDSAVSVIEIVKHIIKNYNKGKFIYEYKDKEEYHEANLLLLDITKAKRILEWQPIYDIEDTIKATVEWYKKFENEDCYKLCVVQINEFIQNMDKLKYK